MRASRAASKRTGAVRPSIDKRCVGESAEFAGMDVCVDRGIPLVRRVGIEPVAKAREISRRQGGDVEFELFEAGHRRFRS